MVSGLHQWTVELVADTTLASVSTGIASTGVLAPFDDPSNIELGEHAGGWAINDEGWTRHAGQDVATKLRRFSVGTKITFTLDLRPGNGTLVGFIQGRESDLGRVGPFSNLLQHLEESPGGFVPAVSTRSQGGLRFLSIQKLED